MPNRRPVVVGVPIKPFDAAKQRLAAVLDGNRRRDLARFLATNTLAAVAQLDCELLVLAADEEVTAFASALGYRVLSGAGLNESGSQLQVHAADSARPWMILHADLPYLTSAALFAPIALLTQHRSVIAFSPDGGTPVLGHVEHRVRFSYGPASFHRHLRQLPGAEIVRDWRLSCDIDRPLDLDAAKRRLDQISSLLRS